MDTQEDCPGFMVLEENIVEEDENFVISGLFFLSYNKKGVLKLNFYLACFR